MTVLICRALGYKVEINRPPEGLSKQSIEDLDAKLIAKSDAIAVEQMESIKKKREEYLAKEKARNG